MVKKCLCCGKEFKVFPSEYNTKKYCGRECKYKHLGQIRRKRIIVNCANCGKEKETWPSKEKEHNFCNKKCMGEYYSKVGTEKCICFQCGKEFIREKHKIKSDKQFCSNKCSSSYNNSKNKKRIIIKCDYCNKDIERRPCEINREGRTLNFCNKECKGKYDSEYFSGENNPNWKGGHDEYRGENWERQRRSARERDNKTCVDCGANGKDVELSVHHIVPFRFFNNDYKTANKIRNLKTLCRSCHSKQKSHKWNEVPKEYEYLLSPTGRR